MVEWASLHHAELREAWKRAKGLESPGKGSGSRACGHLTEQGEGRKNRRIREIQQAGVEEFVRQLVSDLSEAEAFGIEAQLIAAHGTVDTGGILPDKVFPSGSVKASRSTVAVPAGATEKAQLGLKLLKDAILELAAANPEGIRNADAPESVLRTR